MAASLAHAKKSQRNTVQPECSLEGSDGVQSQATMIHWPLAPEKWKDGWKRTVRMEHHL